MGGVDAVELRAGRYAATFLPGLGMLGASLTCDGLEHLDLTGGLDRYREGHTTGLPLLHPWANRLARLTYEADGTWVDIDPSPPVHLMDGLPIHGTMTAAPGWQVEAVLADASRALVQCRYDFGRDPVRLASFPFPHDLVVFAELSDLGLRVTTTVLATGSVPVPVSFGWHPYFTLPGVRRADLSVVLPDREQVELDGRMLPTGNLRSVAADTVLLGDGPDQNALDDAYRLGPDAADRRFLLTGTTASGETRSLRVEVLDGYAYAQVYAPRGAAVAAIEPMTAPINALVTGDHPSVAPGAQLAATFAVAVPAADPAPLTVADADAAGDPDPTDDRPS
jgi:galactose mutarotase-like enzyme